MIVTVNKYLPTFQEQCSSLISSSSAWCFHFYTLASISVYFFGGGGAQQFGGEQTAWCTAIIWKHFFQITNQCGLVGLVEENVPHLRTLCPAAPTAVILLSWKYNCYDSRSCLWIPFSLNNVFGVPWTSQYFSSYWKCLAQTSTYNQYNPKHNGSLMHGLARKTSFLKG